MKNIICIALALMVCMILTSAFAGEDTAFTFVLNSEGDGYIVTAYQGSETAVIVPDQHLGKPVTTIGESAFRGNTVIRSIALPSSVTRIDAGGFKGCTNLTDISNYAAEGAGIRIPGDADDDGAVDIGDALCILCHDAGEGNGINISNADVNADGVADIKDALILLQFEAGWDVQLK